MPVFKAERTLAPLMLLLMLGWSLPAPAFFCLLPGKSHQHRPTYAPPPFLPPLGPGPYPRLPTLPRIGAQAAAALEYEAPGSVSDQTAPEVIDGYRFRPLRNRPQATAVTNGVVSTDK